MDLAKYGIHTMDDLRARAEEYRGLVPEETYQAILSLFGLLPNQGDSVPVPLSGEMVDIDASIAPLIAELYAAGVPTLACCSGRPSEHTHSPFPPSSGYLSLPYQEDRLVQLQALLHDPLLTVEQSDCYLQPSISIVLGTTDEWELTRLWPLVRHAVLSVYAQN